MLKLLAKAIAFGTTRYPEKVARRLRLVNMICWGAALMVGQFSVRRFLDPTPGMVKLGFIAMGIALLYASIPLLHRFGAWAAISVLTVLAYVEAVRTTVDSGIGGGYWISLLDAAALVTLILGAERIILSIFFSALALALLILLHVYVPYDTGDLAPDRLRAAFFSNLVFNTVLIFAVVIYASWQIARAETAAESARARSDALLFNIMPESIAERLKREPGRTVADRYEDVSVLFADMAGFTARASTLSPEALVGFLDRIFAEFDDLIAARGVEKIKSSGDAYMVAAGLPDHRPDHAEVLAELALEMHDAAARLDDELHLRIGIATGPVVAGVVGSRKYFYDIWGDTVNLASRMESTAGIGQIQVTEATAARLGERFQLEPRGPVEVKGKGILETWYVKGRVAA
ncbi:MAG: adenylate/guanylate cyclase domain-containing protein [Rhizobium sp.]|nr:adenylate/guanylate cyclase domain-containing protein [Rhizobium sp.]